MESFTQPADDSLPTESNSTHPFDDNFLNYDTSFAPPSHNFTESDSPSFDNAINNLGSFSTGDDAFSHPAPDATSSPPIYGEYSSDGDLRGGGTGGDGAILPPPAEMGMEEGLALREWRRVNAMRLEEKEKREKEILKQIIDEAEEFKVEFYRKMTLACENNKTANREKEKLFLANQEKFHAEADKDYWKSIAELIPKEVPAIEKKRGKKDQEKKPSVLVIQGPKPGKPTDLSRMRHILLKLKHDTPPHLKLTPPPPPASDKDAKSSDGGVPTGPPNAVAAAAVTPEPVAAA